MTQLKLYALSNNVEKKVPKIKLNKMLTHNLLKCFKCVPLCLEMFLSLNCLTHETMSEKPSHTQDADAKRHLCVGSNQPNLKAVREKLKRLTCGQL